MVTTKHCAYVNCNSDSRYSEKPYMKGVFFLKFPGPKRHRERCKKWAIACSRIGFTVDNVTKHCYICSKHFVGGNGPSELHPDPIPATVSSSPTKNCSRPTSRVASAAETIASIPSPPRKRMCVSTICKENDAVNTVGQCYSAIEYEAAEALELLCAISASPECFDELQEMFTRKVLTDIGECGWAIQCLQNNIFLSKKIENKIVICVEINSRKTYTINVLGQEISSSRLVGLPTIVNSTEDVLSIVKEIDKWNVCVGNNKLEDADAFKKINRSTKAFLCTQMNTVRTNLCLLLTKGVKCTFCILYGATLRKAKARHSAGTYKRLSQLVVKKKNKLIRKLRKKNSRTQQRIKLLLNKKNNLVVSSNESQKFIELARTASENLKKNSFLYLFVQEQIKMASAKNPCGRRWHPIILKWCAYIQNKSATTYTALRESVFFSLPSKSTLYKHVDLKQTKGISIKEITDMANQYFLDERDEHQKYICIVHDEMAIKSDIVYDKHTGELIGFVNLNEVGNELATLENDVAGSSTYSQPNVATHMLVLLARGITSELKQSFASFPVNGMTSENLHLIMWEAIEKLEIVGFRVLGVVSDGAGINRKFYRTCAYPCLEFPYKTSNPYAPDEDRDIYFISDAPHLLKTIRNCFSNSNFHQKSRRMWKSDGEILWTHVVELYEKEVGSVFKQAHKLTYEHVYLSSFSRMRVKLAAQVMSETTASSMEDLLGSDVKETVKFIRIVNKWFDIMNTRHLKEGVHRQNENILPFSKTDDERLEVRQCDLQINRIALLGSY